MPEDGKKAGNTATTFRNLTVTGLPEGTLQDIVIEELAGSHGSCQMVWELDKELEEKALVAMEKQSLCVKNDAGIIFCGVIGNLLSQKIEGNRQLLKVQAWSNSCQLDIERRTRTFQNPKKTLADVLKKIAESYTGGKAELNAEKPDTVIERMLYQENETDWEFLKRLAESLGILVFVDCKTDVLRIALGNAFFVREGANLVSNEVCRRVPLLLCKQVQENTDAKARSCYYGEVDLSTKDLSIGVGYDCMYEDQKQMVRRSVIKERLGILENSLTIVHAEGCRPHPWNELRHWNQASVLMGKVLEVKGTDIRVQFACDKEQKKEEALWIPYENEMGNYLYSMPDENDTVVVYFQENGMLAAFSSVRSEEMRGKLAAELADRGMTAQGHGIGFQKDSMFLAANQKEKASVLEEKADGIYLQAKKDVVMESSGDIVLQAAGGNGMDGQAQFFGKHMVGFAMYSALGGQPPTAMMNPSPSMVGFDASGMKSAGSKQEKPELSELAKELAAKEKDKKQDEKKEQEKSSSGGGGGKTAISAGKDLTLKVGDSAIGIESGSISLKTKAVFAIGTSGASAGGTGSIGKDSPKARSSEIKAEHGSEDRAKGKEKGEQDGKKISRGKLA